MRLFVMAACLLVTGCGGATPTPSSTPAPPTATPTAAPSVTGEDSKPWIAYDWFTDRPHHKDVMLARSDGTEVHALATSIELNSDHGNSDWSPDGQTIAFVTGEWYVDTKIWTVSLDGSNVQMLLGPTDECRLGVNFPAYSPDGTRLLYVCDDGAQGDDAHITETLMILDLASGTSTSVATFALPDELLAARWSPDSMFAVVELNQWAIDGSEVNNVGSEIAVVTLADGTVNRLAQADSWAGSPDWSWTNNTIVYGTYSLLATTDMTKPSAIFTVRADGSNLTQITTGSNDGTLRVTGPRWTPDGTQLVVSVGLGHGGEVEDVKIGFLGLDGTLSYIPADGDTRSGAGARLQPVP